MKILLINWQDITNPLSGGAEVHLHEIFKRFLPKEMKLSFTAQNIVMHLLLKLLMELK